MPIIKAKILNKSIDLNYEEKDKSKLLKLIENLNNRLKKFDHLSGKVSDIKVFILTALKIEDDLMEEKKIISKKNTGSNDANEKLTLEIINLKDKIRILESKLDEKNKITLIVEKEIEIINNKINNLSESMISTYEE
tara:strand:+ start:10347 stop:10757 length:411 start_codon:yes stop_codon:yes gene_type:complete